MKNEEVINVETFEDGQYGFQDLQCDQDLIEEINEELNKKED